MSTDPTPLESIEATETGLHYMALRGSIPDETLYKGLVLAAYEYIKAGYSDRAMNIVMGIPQDYFRSVAPTQMREDVEFFQRAHSVYREFHDIGIVPFQFPFGNPQGAL